MLNVMGLSKNNSGIKFLAMPRSTKIKNVTSLLDVNMNVKELKHDIVLNIRFDGNQLTEYFRSVIERSLSEDYIQVGHNNEGSVRELTVNEKDMTPELWIDDETCLTCREVGIMEKLSKGLLNKEIADCLGLSLYTVKNHLKNVFRKLYVGNRSEAIVKYSKIKDKIEKETHVK